ncbi:AB hydrolase superfamily protein B1A11,02 [Talaromyces islandicus]|uniref:AB hydrolase superfamily protein B1A11,02 n=1 Tax=Talaromyces islandicus TaxID=28573 RepID=A0A0U1M6L7_TALIS|nr:AB hydrolase superfamily protein B1A11,02 [Talaromyces islandicus]
MDFSRYGIPNKEWLELVAGNPAVGRDASISIDHLGAAELRAAVNSVRETESKRLINQSNLAHKINIQTLYIPSRSGHSIPLRRYSPNDSRESRSGLIYFHGGGYLFGSEGTNDYHCAKMADSLGVKVLSVIYRHTPDWQHPAQHEDALDALVYIKANASNLGIDEGVGVLGISAGAGLAAAITISELEMPEDRFIKGVVLGIPWLIHVENYPFELFAEPHLSSQQQCREAPVIPWPRLKMFSDLLHANKCDPQLNVALAPNESLRRFPRTAILVAGMDPLRDDGLVLATKLQSLGVPTNVSVFPGLPHGFSRWADLPASKAFNSRMLDCIRWTLGLDECLKDNFEDWYEYTDK